MSLFSGDEAQLQTILNEGVDRLALPKLADQLQAIIRTEIDNASTELQGSLAKATADIGAELALVADDAHSLLDHLNGTTLTVNPITFTLNIPTRNEAATAEKKGITK